MLFALLITPGFYLQPVKVADQDRKNNFKNVIQKGIKYKKKKLLQNYPPVLTASP